MKQTPLHFNINKKVLSYIPIDSTIVVDLGCMSGILAREYKKINSNCHYVGVDISTEYIEEARKYCDETYVLNIEENINIILDKKMKVDCWVMGDILEHLVDPWKLMGKIIENSESTTKFVICVPNFQHWTIQHKLLLGNLFYEESGLLDKSHLRLFTRKSLLKFTHDIGLDVIKMTATRNSDPLDDPAFQNLINFAEAKGYDKKLFITESIAFQYVILGAKNININ
jgi:2-polyprenyl-3-methyl-5-hydroxy-6-metoxy-1,4-benzoquinol methylase